MIKAETKAKLKKLLKSKKIREPKDIFYKNIIRRMYNDGEISPVIFQRILDRWEKSEKEQKDKDKNDNKDIKNKIVCKLCIACQGLRGIDLFTGKCPFAFDNQNDFIEHLEKEHNYKVIR